MINGLIIGRFIPPHGGHTYLIEYASQCCDRLYIMLCALKSDPVPGELRLQWMQEIYPTAEIIYVDEENPDAHRDNPAAPMIWARAVKKYIKKSISLVFSSEEYGLPLAKQLHARWMPLDISRTAVPVSGQNIREYPAAYWEFIPKIAQSYFVQNIVLQIREDALLVRKLAAIYDTSYCGASVAQIKIARAHAQRFVFIATYNAELPDNCHLLISREESDGSDATSPRLVITQENNDDIVEAIREYISENFLYNPTDSNDDRWLPEKHPRLLQGTPQDSLQDAQIQN